MKGKKLVWVGRFLRMLLEMLFSWTIAFINRHPVCYREREEYSRILKYVDPEEELGKVYPLDKKFLAQKRAKVERIAIFAEAFWPKTDGVTRTAYLTLCHLKQTGREVIVFAPNLTLEKDLELFKLFDAEIVLLPSSCLRRVPKTRVVLSTPRVWWIIQRKLRAFRPDAIQLFSPALFCTIGVRYAQRHNIPVVGVYQTDLPGYVRHYFNKQHRLDHLLVRQILPKIIRGNLRYIHNHCDINLAPSVPILDELQEQHFERLFMWGRGVDSERFHPKHRSEIWREKLLNGRPLDSLLCVYVGRIDREKHIDLLLEVAVMEGVALTIVGDGAAMREVKEQFQETETYFAGKLGKHDLPAAYASADVFVFPSPTETFGQVVQEAMASGLPTVVINQGGAAALVKDGKTGYLCPDSPRDFAHLVERLRDNPEQRLAMGINARAEAELRTWEKIMEQLEEYYTLALQSKGYEHHE